MKAFIGLLCALFGVTLCQADDHAVVLLYHHVSKDTPAMTSVSPAVFDRHLDYLEAKDFTVWPLTRILTALQNGEELPKNTVAITFDDAYLSVYTEAFPRLKKRGWPFTLFVNSAAIDSAYRNYMDWEQIRNLVRAGVDIANHSHSHAHLVRYLEGESETQWHQRIRADIQQGADRLETEAGVKSDLFAYPYGEYSSAVKEIVKSMGYRGIAQQSGAVGADSDFLAIPRFPMSTGYADLKRFATSVHTRPLPVKKVSVDNAEPVGERLDKLRLTLAEGSYRQQQLGCYNASGSPLKLENQGGEFTITLSSKQAPGRNKINCTAPASDDSGAYYWYSYQWLVRNADGSWYRE